jgi:hypothetical protein
MASNRECNGSTERDSKARRPSLTWVRNEPMIVLYRENPCAAS